LGEIARRHGATPAEVALAWLLGRPGVVAIPKAANLEHVRANRRAHDLVLDPGDLRALDAAFPPPATATPLEMI
jgi:diketogulonate reductase-like aldo/keto reductase